MEGVVPLKAAHPYCDYGIDYLPRSFVPLLPHLRLPMSGLAPYLLALCPWDSAEGKALHQRITEQKDRKALCTALMQTPCQVVQEYVERWTLILDQHDGH